MIRLIALLLAVMITVMSVPAPAMTVATAPHAENMADCSTMPGKQGDPAVPMGGACQKCCLATLAMPMAIAQPVMVPIAPLRISALPLVAHLATPEPPPPRTA